MIPSKLTGSMIREWRDKLGWSQNETAEKLGISEGSLRSYEKGTRTDKEAPIVIPLLLDWALSAVAAGLKPFSQMKRK